ncbi:ethylmalonyl-CoA decarboxylase-like [Oppia nitens]|uniref:ethylmalonyl-CoA decarboxylase-like n=1 Tax=Oppia nitens TaxID=1686743 RepID=UPI0023D9D978|nr:ethylmalonyl-CoA decarboxylase-like [Oppia nitens]
MKKQNIGSIDLTKNEVTKIATICINNYNKRNAMSVSMIKQFDEVITELQEWYSGKFIIIIGKNGFFCSGADLDFVRNNCQNFDSGYQYSTSMHSLLARLQSLPLLTVAAIDGQALGGGAEIATACDIRVMTRNAKIGFIHILVGVTTGWSGGTRLTRLLGCHKALDLMMSGKVLSAEQAFDLGLSNHIFNNIHSNEQFIEQIAKWLNNDLNINDRNNRVCAELL